MAKKVANYEELKYFVPENDYEENYALLTHYLEMSDGGEKINKRNELVSKYHFDIKKLNDAHEFISKKNVHFKCHENTHFTFIDLFAGIGGFRLAMQNIGGKCVFSSEWDNDAKQTYYENYGEVPFGDITKDETKSFIPKKFDILCAGFPCQAFSIAGYQKGFDDVRGTLFFDVADILKKHRPKAFYLENVKNLQGHDNGKTFSKIMDILENRLNYKVFYKVMSPSEYTDIPQNRERIFIIGLAPEQMNIPNDYQFTFPDKMEKTVKIGDIINYEISDNTLIYDDTYNSRYYPQMKDVIKKTETVYQWRRVYVRENKSNECPTLTANMGGGGHNVPLIWTGEKIRKLSPEECLGFQGFPVGRPVGKNIDKPFRFPSTITQSKKYKQAGNSVTTPLIERVAIELVNYFTKHQK